jgi:hypothetical protein
MALQGPIPVEFGHVFACGVFAAGAVEPVRDFEASRGDRFVQSKDKASGLPLWVIEVIDADPEARAKTVRVKIAAPVQRVLPPPLAGSPFMPVEFSGMTVTRMSIRRDGWRIRCGRPGCPRLGSLARHRHRGGMRREQRWRLVRQYEPARGYRLAVVVLPAALAGGAHDRAARADLPGPGPGPGPRRGRGQPVRPTGSP